MGGTVTSWNWELQFSNGCSFSCLTSIIICILTVSYNIDSKLQFLLVLGFLQFSSAKLVKAALEAGCGFSEVSLPAVDVNQFWALLVLEKAPLKWESGKTVCKGNWATLEGQKNRVEF